MEENEKMCKGSKITLEREGKEYSFDFDWGGEYPESGADYMWEEGNYSCDCNKNLFIGRYCEKREVPNDELKCGDTIKLVKLEHY